MAATDLRVHLGEALRRLEHEDIVVEKGGVPVALLTRYAPEAEQEASLEEEYRRAVGKPAEPGGWEKMQAAMEKGWPEGFDAEGLIEEIYRRRDEGAGKRVFALNDGGDEGYGTERQVPARQRRVHRRAAPKPASGSGRKRPKGGGSGD